MIERNDFTNFQVFYDIYKSNKPLIEKLFSYNISFKSMDFKEQEKSILRFLYTLIYELFVYDNKEIKKIEKLEIQESVFSDTPKKEIHNEIYVKNSPEIEKKIEEKKANEWDIDDKFIFS